LEESEAAVQRDRILFVKRVGKAEVCAVWERCLGETEKITPIAMLMSEEKQTTSCFRDKNETPISENWKSGLLCM
jgi:hypothetical protein